MSRIAKPALLILLLAGAVLLQTRSSLLPTPAFAQARTTQCCTNAGKCVLPYPIPVGEPCECWTNDGTVRGEGC